MEDGSGDPQRWQTNLKHPYFADRSKEHVPLTISTFFLIVIVYHFTNHISITYLHNSNHYQFHL